MDERVKIGIVGSSGWNVMLEMFRTQSVGPRLFIDSILEDRPIAPGFYDGFKAQQVIDAAFQSHQSGFWVEIPDIDRMPN